MAHNNYNTEYRKIIIDYGFGDLGLGTYFYEFKTYKIIYFIKDN